MPAWIQWLTSGGVVVLIGYIVAWPKNRGEGRKATAEGVRAEAEADSVDTEARIKEWSEHIRFAREARDAADDARKVCQQNLGRSMSAWESNLDASDKVLALGRRLLQVIAEVAPDAVTREDFELVEDLQATLRASRHELWELK